MDSIKKILSERKKWNALKMRSTFIGYFS